jgi:hypothetical protein
LELQDEDNSVPLLSELPDPCPDKDILPVNLADEVSAYAISSVATPTCKMLQATFL